MNPTHYLIQMIQQLVAMPTCWNGQLGKDNDHKDHMTYTVDGSVAGDCPAGFDKRVPQIQLFVRIENYKGKLYDYVLSDENTVFHVDFLNGWEEGKLQDIIDNCPASGDELTYNPPCNCDQFLTPNTNVGGTVCDSDVRSLVIDEPTDVVSALPRGGCVGEVIPKSWTGDPPLTCQPEPPVEDDEEEDDNNQCTDGNGKFVLKKKFKTGKLILKRCKYFENRSAKFISRKCKNKVNYEIDPRDEEKIWRPPQAVCLAACNSCGDCYQNNKSKFLYSIDEGGEEVKKRCSWLLRQSNAVRSSLCSQNLDGSYPNAVDICPVTCRPSECS